MKSHPNPADPLSNPSPTPDLAPPEATPEPLPNEPPAENTPGAPTPVHSPATPDHPFGPPEPIHRGMRAVSRDGAGPSDGLKLQTVDHLHPTLFQQGDARNRVAERRPIGTPGAHSAQKTSGAVAGPSRSGAIIEMKRRDLIIGA